jgi:nicotinamide-nucleotide amidase
MTQPPLQHLVGEALKRAGFTISTAESCTGGLIGSLITDVSGSSDYMLGGIISYSNEAKMKFLNVQEQTLKDHGAVSQQTAEEMARGAKTVFGSDVAVSVTGIAGPGGGTPDKPVGLTYIGLATPDGHITVKRFVWSGGREENKRASAEAALQMIANYLSE